VVEKSFNTQHLAISEKSVYELDRVSQVAVPVRHELVVPNPIGCGREGRAELMRMQPPSAGQYATENIIEEPDWQVDSFDWEMRLLDFRVIQPERANGCRW
jgi:hypothetical protein